MRNKRKPLFIFFAVLVTLLAFVMVFTVISPIPVAYIARFAFRNGMAVAPDNYSDILSKVDVTHDVTYPSKFGDNFADIYVPNNGGEPFPVVLWVHGGAFVGGDKHDVEIYAASLAAEGIAVVCINYARAPEAKYPTPVIQTNEAYLWLCDIAAAYSFDMTRFILAGDSAGAHIVTQFAAIQSNPVYADEMGMAQAVPLDTLKAMLLYCGPYNAAKLEDSGSKILDFLMGQTAWSYFGTKDWVKEFSYQANAMNFINEKFPPAFITDGNTMSFEDHGRDLAAMLEMNGVPVETYFINAEIEAAHEYQFIMNTPAGMESFAKAVEFIRRYCGE